MPSLACRICGRVVYTTAPIETLFAEESRCPRCGGSLYPDRRIDNRRRHDRRQNPTETPGPPGAERRIAQRRQVKRRRDDANPFAS